MSPRDQASCRTPTLLQTLRESNGSASRASALQYGTAPGVASLAPVAGFGAGMAKPSDWRLMGVVCGPRELDPTIRSTEEWCAWARRPKGERLEGRGTGPKDALLELTINPRSLSA